MAAIVTVPVALAAVTSLTPSTTIMPPLASVTSSKILAPVMVNLTGVRHVVQSVPIKRWNGSTWVLVYAPHQ